MDTTTKDGVDPTVHEWTDDFDATARHVPNSYHGQKALRHIDRFVTR